MKHARDDYNRMQDPALADPSLLGPGSTPIGEDEPVCLFRCQDVHFIPVLRAYRQMVNTGGGDHDKAMTVIRSIDAHIVRAEAWTDSHPQKLPDLPEVPQP